MGLHMVACTRRHLPLDGGGWEGVRQPRYPGQTPPSLTLPARGRVSTETSGSVREAFNG